MSEAVKRCSGCGTTKPLSEFYRRSNRPGGYREACKDCWLERARIRRHGHGREGYLASQRAYRAANPEKVRNSTLVHRYGITLAERDQMLTEQNGMCYLCERTDLEVDHCHRLGHVRALLCRRCNTTLGMVDDDVDLLLRMANYVKEFSDGREFATS